MNIYLHVHTTDEHLMTATKAEKVTEHPPYYYYYQKQQKLGECLA